MITRAASWLLLASLALALATPFTVRPALLTWLTVTGLLCGLGAWLIAKQPLGVATNSGRIGSCAVQWGWAVGRGQLLPAALISWLVWFLSGTAVIVAAEYPSISFLLLTWLFDGMLLLYLAGIAILQRQRGNRKGRFLLAPAALLGALIASSGFVWFHYNTDSAHGWALALAGGPLLLGTGWYGIFCGVLLATGRTRLST